MTVGERIVNKMMTNASTSEFDRGTALAILKEFSRDMYPSYDLFGNKTLVISRDKFEEIRKKYLG